MRDSQFLTTLQEQVKNGQKYSYLCFWGHSQKTSGKIDKSCLDGCEYFHIMGCSVFNENMIDLFNNLLPELKGRGIKVTFDPNFRKEFMENPRIKELIVKSYV